MYPENLAVLLLLILSFISSGKLCMWRSPINALEEEYFLLCCSEGPRVEGQVAHWYKEKEGKQVLVHRESRIDLNGTNLQFWPVVLNDTGIYDCCLSNGIQEKPCKKWSLNVVKRDKNNCFTEEHVHTGIVGVVGKSYFFTCSDTDDSVNVVDLTWYKNCVEIVDKRGKEKWHIDQLTEEDGGKYTCVKTVVHAGKRYNSTSTTRLKVKGTEENVTPKLIGPDHNVFKTEIGKEEILNCTVFLGYSKNFVRFQYVFYWIESGVIIETCQKSSSLCQMEEYEYDKDGKKHAVSQLWFKSVKEEDINSLYTCTFTENKPITQTFILQKESNPDLPVHVFTTGMIMAIMFSFVAVMMVILCVIFKIELFLLFRVITGKDETLEDGKLYDAFVSYLKDSTPICGEERKFALEILPKTLEDHFGYKLCIFERDISPGGAIVDDIQSFIDRSRRLIIILSRNYISDQVMFELEIGLHKALVERKIKVILIEYTPKSYFDFLPKSLELLSSSQVVKWKEEKSLPLNSKFWKKLRYAMPAKPTMSAVCQGVTLQDRQKRTSAFCITPKPSIACY
ncbi:interleukin-18 receptor 1 [Python bivittatus]|uniref:Interleukin-18 receptor 1 n=1 Tax=Python bivittatus TaxID=176946 RepID=A0A9F2R867_PYTBI|nr:interleukin-18 receptor 1 [Python bivittatus]